MIKLQEPEQEALTAMIVITIICYLVGSLISASFVLYEWNIFLRIVIALVWVAWMLKATKDVVDSWK